jgi:ubiquinone/menaquinone biosynthesis C-methylase UbiE
MPGDGLTQGQRVLALMDHLGLARAHMATQMPGDVADIAALAPERIAGLVLVTPSRLDAGPFEAVAQRLVMIAAEKGLTAETTARAAARLPEAQRHVLSGYDAPGWADVMVERGGEIVADMTAFLARQAERGHASSNPTTRPREGSHAGIRYSLQGEGPALLLLPFFLAPSQWQPAIAELSRHFTVVLLAGAHIGGVAALEDRARAPTYQAMFRTLVDLMAPKSGEAILDVGCGAGSLDRLLAIRLGAANPITAVDVNPFLLEEAAHLAREDGVASTIRFAKASAEALPFLDASFGCAFSVTVLEECDADKAIAEMLRVTRPGGRIGIVVRAIDMAQWWSLALPEAVRRKAEVPAQSVAARGVADASLYERMKAAGLQDLVPFPSLVTLDRPGGPIWRYREDHAVSLLNADERATWQSARETAAGRGLLFQAHPMHAAVGRRA